MQDKSLIVRVDKRDGKNYLHWTIIVDLRTSSEDIPLYLSTANSISTKLLGDESIIKVMKEYSRDQVLSIFKPSGGITELDAELIIDVIFVGFEKQAAPGPVSMKPYIISNFTQDMHINRPVVVNHIFENQEVGSLQINCNDSSEDITSVIIFKNTKVNMLNVHGRTMKEMYLKDNSSIIYVSPFLFSRKGIIEDTYTGIVINSMYKRPIDVTDFVVEYNTQAITYDVSGEVYKAYFNSIAVDINIDSTSSLLAEHYSLNVVAPFATECQLQSIPITQLGLGSENGKSKMSRSTSLIFKVPIPNYYYKCTQPLHVFLSANKSKNRKEYSVHKTELNAGPISAFTSMRFSVNENGTRYILTDDEHKPEFLKPEV